MFGTTPTLGQTYRKMCPWKRPSTEVSIVWHCGNSRQARYITTESDRALSRAQPQSDVQTFTRHHLSPQLLRLRFLPATGVIPPITNTAPLVNANAPAKTTPTNTNTSTNTAPPPDAAPAPSKVAPVNRSVNIAPENPQTLPKTNLTISFQPTLVFVRILTKLIPSPSSRAASEDVVTPAETLLCTREDKRRLLPLMHRRELWIHLRGHLPSATVFDVFSAILQSGAGILASRAARHFAKK